MGGEGLLSAFSYRRGNSTDCRKRSAEAGRKLLIWMGRLADAEQAF